MMRKTRLPVLPGMCMLAGVLVFAAGTEVSDASALRVPVAAGHVRSEALPEDDRMKADYSVQFPLTGLFSTGQKDARPIAVMVENSPAARPQSGLGDADVVYEILAEGDITRFAAFYHCRSPVKVGPVRSIRPYYVDVAAAMDAVLVHAGWSQEAMNRVDAGGVDHFDEVYGDRVYYWRSPDRKQPHNLYTSIEGIRRGMDKKQLRTAWTPVLPMFEAGEARGEARPSGAEGRAAGAEGEAVSGEPAGSASADASVAAGAGGTGEAVRLPYSAGYAVSYRYDAASGQYLRWMNGVPHTDAETGRQLAAANVLICRSSHKVTDSAGRRRVDVQGPGSGYVLSGGKVQAAVWQLRDGLVRAYAADGQQEITLAPGVTWIQFVPEAMAVELATELRGS
ncbi:DUF3048 domain-containing protein [Paenibacillus mesotrionivorans]|uniref:DUF3048 domain-containing protein n=1 Tax=Paenibacillus mesotrionivorans TaxID=3160968 RepID=A0ACC7NYS9_9BACL